MPDIFPEVVMVGFSTAQQTINFIPAVALMATKFICFETEEALKRGWTEGLARVLDVNRKIRFETLGISNIDKENIATLSQCIMNELEKVETVYFNVGGGQKTHSIAMWECFRSRSTGGHSNDLAVYANQTTKQIERYSISITGELKPYGETLPLRLLDITLSDILPLYGYSQNIKRSGPCLYRHGSVTKHALISEQQQLFINEPAIREYSYYIGQAYDYYKKREKWVGTSDKKKLESERDEKCRKAAEIITNDTRLMKKIQEELIEDRLTPTAKQSYIQEKLREIDFFSLVGKPRYKKRSAEQEITAFGDNGKSIKITYAFYFEDILHYRFIELIKQYNETNQLTIAEAYANCRLSASTATETVDQQTTRTEDEKDSSEIDILLVTDDCRLIAIDAKTYGFDKKEEDARLRNLNLAGGTFTQFFTVFPYFSHDIETQQKWWKEVKGKNKLRVLPNELAIRKSRFFAITDKTEFYIDNEGMKLFDRDEGILIRSFEHIFEDLQLVHDNKKS